MNASVFVGTYTTRESEGIYAFEFNDNDGSVGPAGVAARTQDPSWIATGPTGRHLYAVNELWEFEGRPGGGVTAYAIESPATLREIGTSQSQGNDPCHLVADPSGAFLLVSNFTSGSLAVLPLREDGTPEQASDVVEHDGRGAHPRRQASPHVHSALPVPGTPFVLAADLGSDELVVYRLDAALGTLQRHSSVRSRPGAGPRHLAMHPAGRVVLVCNELDSTLATYSWDAGRGDLALLAVAPCVSPEAAPLNSVAGLVVSRTGRAYVSNRGDDSISVFAVDEESGNLTLVQLLSSGGAKPRAIALAPSGRWLLAANQDSDSVASFAVDGASGELRETGRSTRVPSPTALAWAP